jgi:hypothetical protein
MDIEAATVIFSRSDGKEARFPLSLGGEIRQDAVARLHFCPGWDGVLATTRAGEDVFLELPRHDGANQLSGRLVVYLDQNQWSTLAKAVASASSVPDPDRDAALRLVEWADERMIILPASSGHHYETTKWGDTDRRYGLGLTVLKASRGWQMRDPVQVRRNEFHDLFRRLHFSGEGSRAAPVFTLEPGALYGEWRSTPYAAPSDFPAEAAFLTEALTSASVSISILLDSQRVEPGPDNGWAAANQRFSDWLDGESRDAQQKRKSIDVFVLSDLSGEIAAEAHAAGITPDQMSDWVRRRGAPGLAGLPSAGLFRELSHYRHLNKGTVWRRNDLTDMVYLSCAGAYADVVVCERHMATPLAQGIRRLGSGAKVFRRLQDAVPVIEEMLTTGRTTDGDREEPGGPTET